MVGPSWVFFEETRRNEIPYDDDEFYNGKDKLKRFEHSRILCEVHKW